MDLINELKELAEWAEANIWEVPIQLPDALRPTFGKCPFSCRMR